MNSKVTEFGAAPGGQIIHRIALTGNGLTAHILTYGATVQDLRLHGFEHSLALGATSAEPYFGSMIYFGSLVGRFANRIANGRFMVGEVEYRVPLNWLGKHALHGGPVGTAQKVWTVKNLTQSSVSLALTLDDGEMGFPGKMQVKAEISLADGSALQIDITATTTKPTPCSFAHHGYFNLDGSADIADHELQVNANRYLQVDDEMLPTGKQVPVAGTQLDFRTLRRIGMTNPDHNFCLSHATGTTRQAAVLHSPANGLSMTVETNAPGLQVYDAAHLPENGLPGLDGDTYGPRAGLALETQAWPDAPNRPNFPSAILLPGEMYHHQVRYVFAAQPAA